MTHLSLCSEWMRSTTIEVKLKTTHFNLMTRLINYEMIYVWSTKKVTVISEATLSPPPLLAPSNVHADVYDNVISDNETLLEMLISRSL